MKRIKLTAQKMLRGLLLAVGALVIAAQPVFAVPLIDYSANNILWYDERGNNICGTAGEGLGDGEVVNAEDNEKTIFFTLLANGFTKIEAAAILGNLKQESGYNPKANQPDGPGRGIVQWSEGGRWDILVRGTKGEGEFKRAKGKDPESLDTQMQFIFHELTHSYKSAYNHFKAANGLRDKVISWEQKYEQAGVSGPRIKNAEEITKKQYYKDAQGSEGGQLGSEGEVSSSTGGGCSADGGASANIDGFVVYSQYDKRWTNKPYGSSRIGPSGCGPSSLAMIITNLTGKSVTPDQVASWGGRFYIPGSGSSWELAPEGAKHWGMTAKQASGVSGINAALRSGAMIWIGGSGSLPFTSGGHVIVIRGVTEDGKWLVGDSAHPKANSMKFDPQALLSKTPGWGYAISK